MTVTAPLLALMRQNYVITYVGPGSADGRRAQVIAVRRRGGGLAARYWLDDATGLPLRRQLFDTRARLFSDDAFTALSLGPGQPAPAGPGRPAVGRPAQRGRAGRPAGQRLAAAPGHRRRHGPVPGHPDGHQDRPGHRAVLFRRPVGGVGVPAAGPASGPDAGLAGDLRPAGGELYALDPDDQSLAWSAGGYVVTIISDAPAAAVDRTVTSLPHASPPDFWDRIGRGIRRIASWADPLP